MANTKIKSYWVNTRYVVSMADVADEQDGVETNQRVLLVDIHNNTYVVPVCGFINVRGIESMMASNPGGTMIQASDCIPGAIPVNATGSEIDCNTRSAAITTVPGGPSETNQ